MTPHYDFARDAYAALGVDTEAVLQRLATIPISMHCWQGVDVGGFENADSLSGGAAFRRPATTPARPAQFDELREDIDKALALIPGQHRLNLHACYADFGDRPKVERNALTVAQFQSWIDWCQPRGPGLDFNPTLFAHRLADDGATLSHADAGVRRFWIAHAIACRQIGAEMGRQLGSPTVTNIWIPDGSKDLPVDRRGPRARLEDLLNAIFAEALDPRHHLDAVESKVFVLGSESYVVGSHEFYLGYAITRQKLLRLDAGHFHPTENLADKISSTLQFVPEILLHVSRGVRWDSDHVVLFDDATKAIMEELVRGGINRVAAWVIGTRATLKAIFGCPAGADPAPARTRVRRRLHLPPRVARRVAQPAIPGDLGRVLPTTERARRRRLDRRGKGLLTSGPLRPVIAAAPSLPP